MSDTNLTFPGSGDEGKEDQSVEFLVAEITREEDDLKKKEEELIFMFEQHSDMLDRSELEMDEIKERLESQCKKIHRTDDKRELRDKEIKALEFAIKSTVPEMTRLRKVLVDGTTRLQNMKADIRREEIKRHIKTLGLILESKTDLVQVQDSIVKNTWAMNTEFKLYEDAARRVREAVDYRHTLGSRIDRLGHEVAQLAKASDVTSVVPISGSYEDVFSFLETGSGEPEPSGTSHIEIITEMLEFMKELKSMTWRFKKAPLGPLFYHVFIKDKKWGALIERILRPHLFTYIVDNAYDRQVLEEIIDIYFKKFSTPDLVSEIPQPIVLVIEHHTQFEPLENKVTGIEGMVEFECINLMDAVRFQCQETFQVWQIFLADVLNAEKIILFKTEHDAFVLMHNQARAAADNQLVSIAYSLDGFEIHPFPFFRTRLITLPPHALYLKIYMDDTISLLKAVVRGKEIEQWQLSDAIETYRTAQFKALEGFESAKKNLEELHAEELNLQIRLKRLDKALSTKLTIEGETIKIANLTEKLRILEEQDHEMEDLLQKKIARHNRKSEVIDEEMEVYTNLEDELDLKKQALDENVLYLQIESTVLQDQIKIHQEAIVMMEKVLSEKVDKNSTDVVEDQNYSEDENTDNSWVTVEDDQNFGEDENIRNSRNATAEEDQNFGEDENMDESWNDAVEGYVGDCENIGINCIYAEDDLSIDEDENVDKSWNTTVEEDLNVGYCENIDINCNYTPEKNHNLCAGDHIDINCNNTNEKDGVGTGDIVDMNCNDANEKNRNVGAGEVNKLEAPACF